MVVRLPKPLPTPLPAPLPRPLPMWRPLGKGVGCAPGVVEATAYRPVRPVKRPPMETSAARKAPPSPFPRARVSSLGKEMEPKMKQESKRTTTVIPAAPGHFTISCDFAEGIVHFDTSPIIAWEVAVVEYEKAEPFRCVTAIPVNNCGFEAVLHPDGTVDRDGCRATGWRAGDYFDSLDAFKAAAMKHYGVS